MTLLLVGLGSLGLALPGARPSLSLRGDPRWFVPLDTAALTLGLAALTLGLGLSAAVGAMHVGSGASLLRYEHWHPGGITASALSALLLVVLAGRVTVAARRAPAEVAGPLMRTAGSASTTTAVITSWSCSRPRCPSPTASKACPPQVVISEGLLDRRGSDLVAFVIDHERSHLRRGHRRSLLVAGLTDALFGRISPVARSTMALRLAVEGAVGRDPLCRRRIALAMSGLADAQWLPAGGIDSLRYRAGQLHSPAAAGARFEITAAAGLVAFTLVGVAAAVEVGGDLSSLVAAIR